MPNNHNTQTQSSEVSTPETKTNVSEPATVDHQVPLDAVEENVAGLISPSINEPVPVEHRSQKDWEAERRKLADVSHEALNAFLKSSIYQRADLLRDTLLIAVTLLIGAMTLYFTGPENIKTVSLFFPSLAVLTAGIVANLAARAEIVRHLQQVSLQIEKNYITIYGASRQVLDQPSVTNIDTAWRVERETPPFPILKKRGEYGHSIAIWTIIAAVVGLTISFSFTISF